MRARSQPHRVETEALAQRIDARAQLAVLPKQLELLVQHQVRERDAEQANREPALARLPAAARS